MDVEIIIQDDNTEVTVTPEQTVISSSNYNTNIAASSIFENITVTDENVSITVSQSTGRSVNTSYIDIELLLKSGTNNRYKLFTYTGDNVSNQKVYEDNTLASLLYDIDYSYSGDDLSNIVVTRVSDNYSYTKTFSYLSGNLISINYV